MLEVHIDPNGTDESYELVRVTTVDEAMNAIRQKFPDAVRSIGWMREVGGGPLEAAWYEAMLEVWPDSQTKQSELGGLDYCALVTNRSLKVPEANAKLFDGDDEVVY